MASLSLPEVENDFDHLDQLDTIKALPKIEVVLLLEFPNYQGTDSGHRRDSRRCLVISARHCPIIIFMKITLLIIWRSRIFFVTLQHN